MTLARGFALALAVAAAAGFAEAREPTPQETAEWDRVNALYEEVKDKLSMFVMRMSDANSDYELTPFFTSDSYTGTYERATKTMEENFKTLQALDAQLGPLREGLAKIEETYGKTPAAVEAKCWAEFGVPITNENRGRGGRMSPDRSKYLSVPDANYPFLFYAEARKMADVPKAWGDKVSEVTIRKLAEAIEQHAKSYAEYTTVDPDRTMVKKLEYLKTAVSVMLPFRADDAPLKEAVDKLDAAIKTWQDKAEAMIDAYRLPDDSPELTSDAGEIVESAQKLLKTSYAQQYVKGEYVTMRVTSDWFTAEKNLAEFPIQYGVWTSVVIKDPADEGKDVVRVYVMKFYTKKEFGVDKRPPFDDLGVNDTVLMRPSHVSGRSGGFFGTLVKLVFGFGCCVLFLGVLGGGGYFAWKQMNAQKDAAAGAKGAPPAGAAPPGAAPPTPPAPTS